MTALSDIYICEGCGHIARDPARDIATIQKAGGLACCPERNMKPITPAALAADETVLAMIGAAYVSAEIAVGSVDPSNEDDATGQQIAEIEAIRLLTPADATAALERALRAERVKALKEAEALRDVIADEIGAKPMSSIHSALSEYRNHIRAMKGDKP